MLLIWAKHHIHIYVPQLKGGDILVFAADPVNASVTYLLKQWFHLIQTCINNCWEGCKQLIRFGDRYLIGTLKFLHVIS